MRSLFVAIVAFASICVSSISFAQAPDSLSFQGFLTNTLGDPVDSTGVSMTFKLYKGSTVVWEETQIVDIVKGVYNVYLGAVTPMDTVAFDEPIDLGIKLDDEASEMSPRTPLVAAAFARALPGFYTYFQDDGFRSGYNVVGGDASNFVAAGVIGATIGGGGGILNGTPRPNSVLDNFGAIGGGLQNTAGNTATVGGGSQNTASGGWATVDGGFQNTADAQYATVGGGTLNQASGPKSTISGGEENSASGSHSMIGGGDNNAASGSRATVGGGFSNRATGGWASIPGGVGNSANGVASFAAGYFAKADHEGTFVWSDRSDPDALNILTSTGAHQFLIRAIGGVGIGTNSPNSQLTVVGKADFDSVQIGSQNTNLKLDVAGGAWDLNGTEGDLRIGTAANRLKIGVAINGLGAGRAAIRAQGTAVPELRLGAEDVDVVIINKGDGLIPVADNTYSLGKSGNRWAAVWVATGVVSSSDRRLKQNIASLEYGLETVLALEPVSYYWRSTPEDGRRLGLIAQDVESIVPEIVHRGDSDDDMMGLNYAELVPVLIRAIQEQDAENKAQQTQIDKLLAAAGEQNKRLAAMEARLLP